MLTYYKFHEQVFAPQPAREVYRKREKGSGWPEQCPPMRQACAFGWDVLSNFDLVFVKGKDGRFALKGECALASDFGMGEDEDGDEQPPLIQRAAWLWEKDQKLPHEISPHVFEVIQHQVKVSSFLFLKTDENQVLLVTEVPGRDVPYRALSAVIETDWYPASYPWHGVLELDPRESRIEIKKGEPLFRLIPLRRDTYQARAMTDVEFTQFFDRGQGWLSQHGHGREGDMVDIRKSYLKQTLPSRFTTDDPVPPKGPGA